MRRSLNFRQPKLVLLAVLLLPLLKGTAQSITACRIHTTDIDNFWQAYDSIRVSPDSIAQANLLERLFLSRASEGLVGFMKLENYNTAKYLRKIKTYPAFWASIRPKTFLTEANRKRICDVFKKFSTVYPSFAPPDVYFTIGCLQAGGTSSGNKLLIGTEIAAADSTVDASEMGDWLRRVFKDNKDVVYLVAHETVHSQQKGGDAEIDGKSDLLGYCLREGAADFIAELILDQPLVSPYMSYGRQHEKALWTAFKKEMYGQKEDNWLYNGDNARDQPADLGYFIGYAICRSYYRKNGNKRQAIRDILQLTYDKVQPHRFLERSGYEAGLTAL